MVDTSTRATQYASTSQMRSPIANLAPFAIQTQNMNVTPPSIVNNNNTSHGLRFTFSQFIYKSLRSCIEAISMLFTLSYSSHVDARTQAANNNTSD